MTPAADVPMAEVAPPEVPDFELIRCIGRGGFGAVWLASNRTTGRLRAVKVIPLESAAAGSPASREIVSLKHLEAHVGTEHPNLLSIHHVGRTAEHFFYVMDPADDVSGTAASADPGYRPATLEHRLDAGPLPAEECFGLTRQLLAGLSVLHAAGVVHRDVKPANCLFVGGELKVADFGLLAEASPLVSRLGTRRYMPADGRMDAKADVYAAGLVIYQMLTGQPVESFPSLGPRTPEIAGNPILRKLNRLSLRAAQPDPDQRFRDGGEMLRRLEASEAEPSRSKRRWLAWSACFAFTAVLVGVVVWRTFPRDQESSPEPAIPTWLEVNFLTEPYYNATIWLDGKPLLDAEQKPWLTPCTVPNVPSGEYHVVFRHAEQGELDAGRIDFGGVCEVEARWPAAPIRAGTEWKQAPGRP